MTVAAALVVTVAVLALVVAALASVDASVEHEHPAHTLAGLIVWGVFLGFAALVTILYLGAFG